MGGRAGPGCEQLAHNKFLQIWEGGRRGFPSDFPNLKSKGAVCRNLAPAIKSLLLHIGDLCLAIANPTLHQEYVFLVEKRCRFYDCIAHEGMTIIYV